MGNSSFKTLCTVDGIDYCFSPKRFKDELDSYLRKRRTGKKYNKSMFYSEAGPQIGLTGGAVKQWYLGKNGPSDIDMVYVLSTILGIDSSQLLVRRSNPDVKLSHANGIQYDVGDRKSVVKAVYLALLDFIDIVLDSHNGITIPECPNVEDPNEISDYYDERFFAIRKLIDAAVFDMPYEEIVRLHALVSEVEDDFRNPGYSLRWNNANPLYVIAKDIMDCESFEEMADTLDDESFDLIMRDYFAGAEPLYKLNILIGDPVKFSMGVLADPGENITEFAQGMVDSLKMENPDEIYRIVQNRTISVMPLPRAIYRKQFAKIILELLREDFADCIPPKDK